MRKGQKVVKDITGLKKSYVTVVSFSHIMNRRTYWNCLCYCGRPVVLSRKSIIESVVISCGCIPRGGKGPGYLRTFEECVAHKINCIMNNSTWKGKCLIWNGSFHDCGLARCSFLNISYFVRELLWFFKNRIPLGKQGLYSRCRNCSCINVDHLELKDGRGNKTIDRLFYFLFHL